MYCSAFMCMFCSLKRMEDIRTTVICWESLCLIWPVAVFWHNAKSSLLSKGARACNSFKRFSKEKVSTRDSLVDFLKLDGVEVENNAVISSMHTVITSYCRKVVTTDVNYIPGRAHVYACMLEPSLQSLCPHAQQYIAVILYFSTCTESTYLER